MGDIYPGRGSKRYLTYEASQTKKVLVWFLSTILCIVEGKSLALRCHDKVLDIVLGNSDMTSPLRETGLCVRKVLHLVKEKDSKQKKKR